MILDLPPSAWALVPRHGQKGFIGHPGGGSSLRLVDTSGAPWVLPFPCYVERIFSSQSAWQAQCIVWIVFFRGEALLLYVMNQGFRLLGASVKQSAACLSCHDLFLPAGPSAQPVAIVMGTTVLRLALPCRELSSYLHNYFFAPIDLLMDMWISLRGANK